MMLNKSRTASSSELEVLKQQIKGLQFRIHKTKIGRIQFHEKLTHEHEDKVVRRKAYHLMRNLEDAEHRAVMNINKFKPLLPINVEGLGVANNLSFKVLSYGLPDFFIELNSDDISITMSSSKFLNLLDELIKKIKASEAESLSETKKQL